MNLQSYIADLITVLNNIVIPFMLGIAFLIFVINAFRFFIVGGTNPDSQDKAKSLAVYGVGAFVTIIIFWGVVNLLTSSLGLQALGDSSARCSDYECPDGNNPIAGNFGGGDGGDGFGTGVGDPRPPGSGAGTGFPTTPDFVSPTVPTTPTMPGEPLQPVPPTDNTDVFLALPADVTASDFGDAAITSRIGVTTQEFITELPTLYDSRTSQIISDSVAAINDTNATNEERAIAAIRLANVNQISDNDLVRYVEVLNADQQAAEGAEINIADLRQEASVPTPELTALRDDTYETMTNIIARADASFWTFESTEREGAIEQVNEIQQAGDPGETIETFDAIMSDKPRISPAQVTVMRDALLSVIDTERFFQGLPPYSDGN